MQEAGDIDSMAQTSATRNQIFRYLFENHFGKDIERVCQVTGYTKQQVTDWLSGSRQPQINVVSYVMHKAFSPEFRVIAEYFPIDAAVLGKHMLPYLKKMLNEHDKASGLYAFYDSMANLVYLGKSDGNLLTEVYQQLRAKVSNPFPKGVTPPQHRFHVVRYISAYYVQTSDFEDHAKHVESLILRISKPALNKNIGGLKQSDGPPADR